MKIPLLLLSLSVSAVAFLQSIPRQKAAADDLHWSNKTLYKVYKIDSIKNYYLIYATRNDSVFKIVSYRMLKRYSAVCVPIRIGKNYDIHLDRGFDFITDNIATWNGIPLEKESRYNLYEAYNLEGLCLK